MRFFTVLLTLVLAAIVILCPAVAVADDSDTIQVSIVSGGLHTSVGAPDAMTGVTLGTGAQVSTGTAAAWTLIDARGSGAGWTLSVSATDFVSAPGTGAGGLDERVIDVENLTITPGPAIAGDGSDAGPPTGGIHITNRNQALVFAPFGVTGDKGSFTFPNPVFSLTFPADALPSNVGEDGVHPYRTVVVFTIA